jgi:hypothetical protein
MHNAGGELPRIVVMRSWRCGVVPKEWARGAPRPLLSHHALQFCDPLLQLLDTTVVIGLLPSHHGL